MTEECALVDLDSHVRSWAVDHFKARATSAEKRLLRKKLIRLEIDWSRVKIENKPPVYIPEPPDEQDTSGPGSTMYQTEYCNKSGKEQSYNVKAERATKTQCQISIQKGYTRSKTFGVEMSAPDGIAKASAAIGKQLSVTNTSGYVVDEQLTWGVDTQITAPLNKRTVVTIKIAENDYQGSFRLETRFSGTIKVNYSNLDQGDRFIKAREHSIYEIFREAASKEKLKFSEDAIFADEANKAIVCVTSGNCSFKYALKQSIEVEYQDI